MEPFASSTTTSRMAGGPSRPTLRVGRLLARPTTRFMVVEDGVRFALERDDVQVEHYVPLASGSGLASTAALAANDAVDVVPREAGFLAT